MNWGFTEDLPDLLSGFTEDLPGIYRFGRFTVRIYPNYHIMAIIMHLQVAALIMVAIITQFETVASPHRVQSSNDGAAPPKYSRNTFFDKPSLKSFFTRSWGHAFVPFRPLLRIVVSDMHLGHPQISAKVGVPLQIGKITIHPHHSGGGCDRWFWRFAKETKGFAVILSTK